MMPRNTAPIAQCPRCGSQWFVKQEFRQYADQFSSSSPGGSMSHLPSDPQYAPVCLCGTLFQPERFSPRGRRLSLDRQSFLESWEKAQKYQLLQREAEERMQKRLRAAAVDPEYIKQLSARVEAAEKVVADLSAELKGRHLKPRRKGKETE